MPDAEWQCPYCGTPSYIEDAQRRRKAIAQHLGNNHADQLNSIGSNVEIRRQP